MWFWCRSVHFTAIIRSHSRRSAAELRGKTSCLIASKQKAAPVLPRSETLDSVKRSFTPPLALKSRRLNSRTLARRRCLKLRSPEHLGVFLFQPTLIYHVITN